MHPCCCPQNDPTRLRETYDGFLATFPLCYGYWQKFADAEARFRGAEEAQGVYERGVIAIPNSIDLWLHYCQFKQSIAAPPDTVRRCVKPKPSDALHDCKFEGRAWRKRLTKCLSICLTCHA